MAPPAVLDGSFIALQVAIFRSYALSHLNMRKYTHEAETAHVLSFLARARGRNKTLCLHQPMIGCATF